MLLAVAGLILGPKSLMRARDAKRKTDLYEAKDALMNYYDSFGIFPGQLPACSHPLTLGSSDEALIASFPCDPKDKSDYVYQVADDRSSFRLYTNLEVTDDPQIGELRCTLGCAGCAYNYGVASLNVDLERCLPPEVIYACSPGGGPTGSCDQYDDPNVSQCPRTFTNDPTCANACSNPAYRCKNASGKHTP